MNEPTLNRRDLNRLALAALGGLVSGAFVGCAPPSTGPAKATDDKEKDKEKDKDKSTASADETPRLLQDPHVCRGINTCKNKGKTGTTNDCAGQGHCATIKSHSCNGMNDCKGQGGCGDNPGENACKGQGGCAVPLKAKTWPKARKRFEELMTTAKKKYGDAPES